MYDFRDPHPGDIVVFNAPPGWDDEPPSVPPSNPVLRAIRGFGQLIGFVPPDGMVLVKRVIAIGGQSVKGDAAGDVFVRDGTSGPWRKLDETYVYETGSDPRAKFGPITVPKGRLWVMGDHRDRSADSRYHCGEGGTDGPDNSTCNVNSATVPVSDVIGKAFVIAWPPSRWTTLGTPEDVHLRVERAGRVRHRAGTGDRAAGLVRAAEAQAAMTPVARLGGRVLLVDRSERVLLIHERLEDGTTHWLTPGGGVEAGEQPREAAAREAYEETGIRVDASRRRRARARHPARLVVGRRRLRPGRPFLPRAGRGRH